MKRILVLVLAVLGLFTAAAQDLIVLRDGNFIEAKVTEIAATEIRYRRLNNVEGPVYVIPVASVLSIKFENGTQQIFNTETRTPAAAQQTAKPQRTPMDPDKLTLGVNANPASTLSYGSSFCLELTKGKFNTEFNFIFPSLSLMNDFGTKGFGGLCTFNYFGRSRIGGAYVGGGLGYVFSKLAGSPSFVNYNGIGTRVREDMYEHLMTLGFNAGYKFVTRSGIYFRTGAFLGLGIKTGWKEDLFDDELFRRERHSGAEAYFKPDITFGYSF